jgi:hypothetical protein
MTGKQLKDFAERLSDEALVEIYFTEDKYRWSSEFRIRGTAYIEPEKE